MDRPRAPASSRLDRAVRLGQISVMVGYPEAAQRIGKLIPLADALATIRALARPVDPKEVEIAAAVGRVLAANVHAAAAHPVAPLALHDGWAVRSGETVDAGSYAPALLSAVPQRVDAGEPLPAGADAVAPLDSIALRGSQAEALGIVAPGQGVLPAGADAEMGMPLRAAGERLRVTDQVLLSVAGISRVAIREPRIRLVRARGGNPAIAAAYGWLAAALAAEGAAVVTDTGDDLAPDHLEAAFRHEASDATLVLE